MQVGQMRLIAFNKPFGVLCQFRAQGERETLARYVHVPGVYPAGRLDADSEGLLLLTDHGPTQARISAPRFKLAKVYLVEVEGIPAADALAALRAGVVLRGERTRPARVRQVPVPEWLWPRDPPVRVRTSVPTAWLQVTLREGRNRQLRRMTAAVSHPTLRLVRIAIGPYRLDGLALGQWAERDPAALGPGRAIVVHPRSGGDRRSTTR